MTERKRTEDGLRESEERFSTVFQASPVGMSITRVADGQYIEVNDAFLSLFGYAREEALSHTSLQLQTWAFPEDRDRLVSMLRVCISTLAGVPSIVFGLFGLAFFINTLHLSSSKSVLAGSATLALLILPTIIRSAEEALKAVPHTYKEAALSLGASQLRMVLTVLLPAALPGILTGIIISMGRAAGETAPIIFTAAVSVGQPLKLWETLSQPTPALPWNIYNLATEHQAVDEIRHVQFGMVLTLVLLVLLLNLAAILIRARISKKMRG